MFGLLAGHFQPLLLAIFSFLLPGPWRYICAISSLNFSSMFFLLSFMAAVRRPDSGVHSSLTRCTACGISNFCNLENSL